MSSQEQEWRNVRLQLLMNYRMRRWFAYSLSSLILLLLLSSMSVYVWRWFVYPLSSLILSPVTAVSTYVQQNRKNAEAKNLKVLQEIVGDKIDIKRVSSDGTFTSVGGTDYYIYDGISVYELNDENLPVSPPLPGAIPWDASDVENSFNGNRTERNRETKQLEMAVELWKDLRK